jgi:putative phosphoribosyl transferase
VILVDDGLATGSTMRAAVEALHREGPARLVVAVPVSAPDTCDAFRDIVWYEEFSKTTDEEVHQFLARTHVP